MLRSRAARTCHAHAQDPVLLVPGRLQGPLQELLRVLEPAPARLIMQWGVVGGPGCMQPGDPTCAAQRPAQGSLHLNMLSSSST